VITGTTAARRLINTKDDNAEGRQGRPPAIVAELEKYGRENKWRHDRRRQGSCTQQLRRQPADAREARRAFPAEAPS
jgi:hypothetical protein